MRRITRGSPARSRTRSPAASTRARCAHSGLWSMLSLDMIAEVFTDEEAWVVGGAIRDDLLGRPTLDLDVACLEPERAARALAARTGDAIFPLNQEFGAWRVLLDRSRTVDFAPLGGASIEADLAGRDFTANAIAQPVTGGDYVDPYDGRADIERRARRTVSDSVFDDDPLRRLRGVRLEDELGFRLDPDAEELTRAKAALVAGAAGERILDELRRLSAGGIERLDELGLLGPLGGHVDARLQAFDSPWFRLTVTFGENLTRLPISGDLRRFATILLGAEAPSDGSPRGIHRFRRATEPFALEALAYAGSPELTGAVEQARKDEPAEPLLRGDELGIEP